MSNKVSYKLSRYIFISGMKLDTGVLKVSIITIKAINVIIPTNKRLRKFIFESLSCFMFLLTSLILF